MATTRAAWFTLALGFAALASGRVLLTLCPAPPEGTRAPWTMPAGISVAEAAYPGTFRADARPIASTQTVTLEAGGRLHRFQRFSHSVERIDSDLVPWFATLHGEHWTEVDTRRIGAEPPVVVLTLEDRLGSERMVLAYAFRVGPYVTHRFNYAKMLQIPAKLRGHNLFEIVTLATPCREDCAEAGEEAVRVLGQLVEANVD